MLMKLARRFVFPTPEYWVDRFWMAIAARLPRPLVAYAAARLMAHATTGKWGHELTTSVTCVDALKRWDEPNP